MNTINLYTKEEAYSMVKREIKNNIIGSAILIAMNALPILASKATGNNDLLALLFITGPITYGILRDTINGGKAK